MKKQWVGNRMKRFCGEKCGNVIFVEGACENPVRLTMYDGHMETVEYMWVNIWFTLDLVVGICQKIKLQKYTSLAYRCSTSERTK